MKTTRHIGWRHLHWEVTDSTNNRAAEWATHSQHSGMVFSADVQTQGRGQHGRHWLSTSGSNILLSVLLFPPHELCRPPILTALGAVAVCDVVEQISGQLPRIKWPNDVYVGPKKICGILTESGMHAGQASPYFVIGLGLNVNTPKEDFELLNLPYATSLCDITGQPWDVVQIRQQVIESLNAEYARCLERPYAGLEQRWATRLALFNHYVTVELMDSSEIQGTLIDVSFQSITLLQSGMSVRVRPEEIRHIR